MRTVVLLVSSRQNKQCLLWWHRQRDPVSGLIQECFVSENRTELLRTFIPNNRSGQRAKPRSFTTSQYDPPAMPAPGVVGLRNHRGRLGRDRSFKRDMIHNCSCFLFAQTTASCQWLFPCGLGTDGKPQLAGSCGLREKDRTGT